MIFPAENPMKEKHNTLNFCRSPPLAQVILASNSQHRPLKKCTLQRSVCMHQPFQYCSLAPVQCPVFFCNYWISKKSITVSPVLLLNLQKDWFTLEWLNWLCSHPAAQGSTGTYKEGPTWILLVNKYGNLVHFICKLPGLLTQQYGPVAQDEGCDSSLLTCQGPEHT